MFCTNCGKEMPEGTAFCTNCGTSLVSAPTPAEAFGEQGIGTSLEAAVQANQDAIDSIEARAQAQVDEAFKDFAPIEDETSEHPAAYEPDQATGQFDTADQTQPQPGASEQAQPQSAATNQTQAVPVPVAAPFYQQDASPNAHYSSQRSYDSNVYGQNTGQAAYGQAYQQPSYGQAGQQAQQTWYPQPATSRALAMVLYISGLIGMIIGLCVRDKSDPFMTHHLNNVVVIFIGSIISGFLLMIGIGFLLLLYLFVMTIMGMINAYNGEIKELPLIGKIQIIK